MNSIRSRCGGVLMVLFGAAVASAGVFSEVEPNEDKGSATAVGPLMPGDAITGISLGSSLLPGDDSADYFLVTLAPASPAIYRHRLVLSSQTPGHVGTIRGIPQTAAPPDSLSGIPWDGIVGLPGSGDITVQTASAPVNQNRYNQWYGFGKGESLYYRVTGDPSTAADYAAVLESTVVQPVDLGIFQPGLITLNWTGQGHDTDTEVWVYDAAWNAIPGYGNDGSSATLGGAPIATTSVQSWLARDFSPGTYYLAVSNFQLATHQASPSDDNFRTGSMLDFDDLVLNTNSLVGLDLSFTVQDPIGPPRMVSTSKSERYDINWFRMTVVLEPSTIWLLILLLGLLYRKSSAGGFQTLERHW